MFRPFRLIMLAVLGLAVYAGFFQSPGGKAGIADFDPAIVAAREVEAWKAAKTKEEVGTMIAHVFQLRELHRFSWFRAVQAGMDMGRTTSRFVDMTGRYERVLENLEAVAAVEKAWKKADFDPAVVARTQLNWMVTLRTPNLSESGDPAGEMAAEYGLRWGLRGDQMYTAAAARTEAFKIMITSTVDPDWDGITKMLEESYVQLQKTLRATRAGQ